MVRVTGVEGDKIMLDLNRPMAGQTLHFDIRFVALD
jgi:FKBP-type peptidyl-prolyl cis-trans isomerase 2